MKEFATGLIIFLGSTIVFSLTIAIGVIFNIFYPIYMSIKYMDARLFFHIWWKLINGTFSAIGDILYEIGVKFDQLANVWGEWIEDSVTSAENTMFGHKQITVSASLGFLEHKKIPINKHGRRLILLLNKVFREKRHAIGSWELFVARAKIKDRNLKGQ